MRINVFAFCMGFVFFVSPVVADSLTKDELTRLQTYELNQSVSFETYTDSDKGAANVLGYHFDAFLTQKWFVGLGIFGAVGGDRGGYGIASVGGGYRGHVTKKMVSDVRVLIGSGGGGGVPAGGGFSVQAEAGLYYPVLRSTVFGFVRGGYLWFPTGEFQSPTVALGVLYHYKVPFLAY